MSNNSRFGKLIGVLDVANSCCKFLVREACRIHRGSRSKRLCLQIFFISFKVYAVKNREILTCHEISIGKIDSSDEDEYDPIELWNAVQEVAMLIDFSQFLHPHEIINLFQGDASSDRKPNNS